MLQFRAFKKKFRSSCFNYCNFLQLRGFEPETSGTWAYYLTDWPLGFCLFKFFTNQKWTWATVTVTKVIKSFDKWILQCEFQLNTNRQMVAPPWVTQIFHLVHIFFTNKIRAEILNKNHETKNDSRKLKKNYLRGKNGRSGQFDLLSCRNHFLPFFNNFYGLATALLQYVSAMPFADQWCKS